MSGSNTRNISDKQTPQSENYHMMVNFYKDDVTKKTVVYSYYFRRIAPYASASTFRIIRDYSTVSRFASSMWWHDHPDPSSEHSPAGYEQWKAYNQYHTCN